MGGGTSCAGCCCEDACVRAFVDDATADEAIAAVAGIVTEKVDLEEVVDSPLPPTPSSMPSLQDVVGGCRARHFNFP